MLNNYESIPYKETIIVGGIKMDRITQSMMEAFKTDLSVSENDPTLLFEHFVNYCIVNNVYGLNVNGK